VGHHQRGALHVLDDVGHGERLTASGDAQQRLLIEALQNAPGQPFHGAGLVPSHLEIRYETKIWHILKPLCQHPITVEHRENGYFVIS
jgi:hypothetical protein